MLEDKIYTDLMIDLDRFINLCNLEDYKNKSNFKRFSEMIHQINDELYMLEIIDKEDNIETIE